MSATEQTSTHLGDMAECLCGLRERSVAAADDTGDGPFTGAALKVATPGGCPLEATEGCGLAVV